MSQRQLQVQINGQLIGSLFDQNNVWGFQYAESWLQQPKPFALSPALPLGPEVLLDGATVRPVQWFFDNLLPEERLREVIGKEEGVEAADAFGLLERLGSESAGALVLQPPGAPDAPQGAVELTREALSARIRNLPRASLTHQAPKRMSLAGAQHKMVVVSDPATGRLMEPLKGSPSTHILKPNSTADGFPHSVVMSFLRCTWQVPWGSRCRRYRACMSRSRFTSLSASTVRRHQAGRYSVFTRLMAVSPSTKWLTPSTVALPSTSCCS